MEPPPEPVPARAGEAPDSTPRRLALPWFWIVVPLGLVAVVAALVLLPLSSDDQQQAAGQNGAGLEDVQSFDVTADHVIDPVEYEQTPPVGGPHNPLWLNCGIYPSEVPNENVVHSMEHGAVWIAYQPDLSPDDIARLASLTPDTYAILSPYPGLPAPIVVSAWGNQLRIDDAADPRIDAFIRAYRSAGDAPEIGAPCTGASDGTVPLDAVTAG